MFQLMYPYTKSKDIILLYLLQRDIQTIDCVNQTIDCVNQMVDSDNHLDYWRMSESRAKACCGL